MTGGVGKWTRHPGCVRRNKRLRSPALMPHRGNSLDARLASRTRAASLVGATNSLDSNPHSASPPLASCQTERGFLLEAYSTLNAVSTHPPVSGQLIDVGTLVDHLPSAAYTSRMGFAASEVRQSGPSARRADEA